METYLVRTNCEYSIEIEAKNEEEALSKANERDFEDWSQAWNEFEVDLG